MFFNPNLQVKKLVLQEVIVEKISRKFGVEPNFLNQQ